MFSVNKGEIWRHVKSWHLYEIVGECLIESIVTEAILYRAADKPTAPIWCRPISEFSDGRFVQEQPK